MIDKIQKEVNDILNKKGRCIIAIDGRCGSGKTSLANELQQVMDCNVFHMDDFFLRKEQRTKDRIETPGENVDHERFLEEVLLPLYKGEEFSFRPYSCSEDGFKESVLVENKKISVIEGSYSCHENLWGYYDLHIFINVDPEEQLTRITNREGTEKAKVFKEKWIPLEEKYFEKFDILKRCELCIEK